jgi:hypothetical protein
LEIPLSVYNALTVPDEAVLGEGDAEEEVLADELGAGAGDKLLNDGREDEKLDEDLELESSLVTVCREMI